MTPLQKELLEELYAQKYFVEHMLFEFIPKPILNEAKRKVEEKIDGLLEDKK